MVQHARLSGIPPQSQWHYYSIGEKTIAVYRREIAHLNRLYAEATKDDSVKHVKGGVKVDQWGGAKGNHE